MQFRFNRITSLRFSQRLETKFCGGKEKKYILNDYDDSHALII